jgi:hypothetical protein
VVKITAYEKIEQLTESEFKLITGVPRATFYAMEEVLREKHTEEHKRGGQQGLPVELSTSSF